MTPLQALIVACAGLVAGAVNTVVGSGTLVTFPVLLAVGFPAVTANVTNAVGLVPGLLTGTVGYRRELAEQPVRLTPFATASLLGGVTGALLLLVLPPAAFRAAVPVFIGLAIVLIVAQPAVRRLLRRRLASPSRRVAVGVVAALFACGVYGGYFGAAQGILLLAILGVVLPERLQSANAVKNFLNLITNVVAATVFVAVADVDWLAALLIAGGSIVGGVLGARIGRSLAPASLRVVVVAVGVVALVRLVTA